MKEKNEKLLARYDPNVDDSFIHKQCAELKRLNLKAKQLIYDLHRFRGQPTGRLHGPKDLR